MGVLSPLEREIVLDSILRGRRPAWIDHQREHDESIDSSIRTMQSTIATLEEAEGSLNEVKIHIETLEARNAKLNLLTMLFFIWMFYHGLRMLFSH